PASLRSTIPDASSPLCSATSRRTLSRSRSWMWGSTACLAVWAAIRWKSSEGSSLSATVPSGFTTRLRTSRAPVFVSSRTVTSPGALNARTYAAARAFSTVCSISSKGMPTSAQSALSASARPSVDGSDCDRKPACDDVVPRDVNDHRRAAARPGCLHSDACRIHRDQLALDDGFRLTAAIADVDALPVEPVVVRASTQRALRTRRRDLEVIGSADEVRVIEQRPGDSAHPLAILDGDRLIAVDGNAKGAPCMARLVKRVQLVTHVPEGGLEQLLDRRY